MSGVARLITGDWYTGIVVLPTAADTGWPAANTGVVIEEIGGTVAGVADGTVVVRAGDSDSSDCMLISFACSASMAMDKASILAWT